MKALVGLGQYEFTGYLDSKACYTLYNSNTGSFPEMLVLDEPVGQMLFASLPEFNYNISEDDMRHVCNLGHMHVYTSIGQEVEHFTWLV